MSLFALWGFIKKVSPLKEDIDVCTALSVPIHATAVCSDLISLLDCRNIVSSNVADLEAQTAQALEGMCGFICACTIRLICGNLIPPPSSLHVRSSPIGYVQLGEEPLTVRVLPFAYGLLAGLAGNRAVSERHILVNSNH